MTGHDSSSATSRTTPLNEADSLLWNELAQGLEAFLTGWDRTGPGQPPPALRDYLPAAPPFLRRLVLMELIKADLEQRSQWDRRADRARRTADSSATDGALPPPTSKRDAEPSLTIGLFRPLEAYVDEFPELREPATSEPPVELIYEEFHVRRSAGESVSFKDFARRFPGSQEALRKLLGGDAETVSSALVPARGLDAIFVGDKLDDFDLLNELGEGAFARVFLARQTSMMRLVALKVSAEKGNEPQTLAQLDHPNIVRVYDQRRVAEQNLRLLYMQYVPGGTLQDVVQRIRAMPADTRSGAQLIMAVDTALVKATQVVREDAPWRRRVAAMAWPEVVCRLGIQLSHAIDYAHRQGVLHRDIKPANILLSAEGSPKLADFNISFGTHLAGATPAAYFGGSLAYMSPEQLEACSPSHSRRPEDLDGRADLYSLGVVLWELLHGQRPFADVPAQDGWRETIHQMIERRRDPAFDAPASAPSRDAIARRLERVLRKALAPNPADRFQTGAEFARELTLCLHGRSWELFHDFGASWPGFARQQPLAAIIPINLVPNVFAGAYNWWFNFATFIKGEGSEFASAFWIITLIINGIAFPLGVVLGTAYAWPVVRMVWRTARGRPCAAEELDAARLRALRMGHVIALIGVAEWLLSGIVFPLGIHLLAGHFPTHGYVHFFLSLAACGLIAGAFPYLGTTWLAVRVFYPALLASGTPSLREQRQLSEIPQQSSYYVAIAAVVPMLAMLLVLFAAPENRLLAGLLIVAGLIGFVTAWLVFGRIRDDVAALSVATRAADSLGIGTETAEGL